MSLTNEQIIEAIASKSVTEIVELIDTVLSAPECDKTITAVREKVNGIMKEYPIFAW